MIQFDLTDRIYGKYSIGFRRRDCCDWDCGSGHILIKYLHYHEWGIGWTLKWYSLHRHSRIWMATRQDMWSRCGKYLWKSRWNPHWLQCYHTCLNYWLLYIIREVHLHCNQCWSYHWEYKQSLQNIGWKCQGFDICFGYYRTCAWKWCSETWNIFNWYMPRGYNIQRFWWFRWNIDKWYNMWGHSCVWNWCIEYFWCWSWIRVCVGRWY